jgi:hypothetical protein
MQSGMSWNWQLGRDHGELLPDYSNLMRICDRSGLEISCRFFAATVERRPSRYPYHAERSDAARPAGCVGTSSAEALPASG